VEKAKSKFIEAVDITPQMAFEFIRVLQFIGVDYVVAPYEGDSQLAYLYKEGFVDAVLTLDSDLLAFGVKRGFYKMSMDGEVDDIDMTKMRETTDTDFSWMSEEDFLHFCILCGCDYLKNIPGLAFKRVNKNFKQVNGDVKLFLKEAGKKRQIDEDFYDNFIQAKLTFRFQRVYCPKRQKIVHLHDPESHPDGEILKTFENMNFLGFHVEEARAK